MKKEFENKIAIDTGGNFGIGRSTEIAFAKKGVKVWCVYNLSQNFVTRNIVLKHKALLTHKTV